MKLFAKVAAGWKYLSDAMFKGDDKSKWILAEALARQAYPRTKFSEFGRLIEYDEPFTHWYEKYCGTFNYHSLDRKYTLDQLMQLVTDVDGQTVECGVWMGASSYLMCRRIAGCGKRHHIFDSFEGLSQPGQEDGSHWTGGDMACGEEKVRSVLKEFDFVDYHKGWIPERFVDVAHERFCFVHIDVDLYQPTYDAIAFFYQRTVPGGVIVCDDYGFITCPGAKRAMDELLADKQEPIILLPTGQGVVFKK